MKLTTDEIKWLEAYKRVLEHRFPGVVLRLWVYGSKARGDARVDSDIDVLVLIREGDWRFKDQLAYEGYDLAVGTDAVPSIQIYTEAEWDRLLARESVFRETVLEEGLPV